MQKIFSQSLSNIGLVLTFSSRIPLPMSTPGDLKIAFAWLPMAGIILSILALVPMLLPIESTWLLAWLYVGSMVWLTRGLHWDGLADVADGLGSNKSGAAFWKVVKDSNLGALGGLCIVMVAIGYIITTQAVIEDGAWFALPWAAALARALVLLMPSLCPVNPKAGLGKILQDASLFMSSLVWLALLFALGVIFLSFLATVLGTLFGFGIVYMLARKAEANGGFNGDFLGATIVLSEFVALLAVAIVI